MKPIHIASAALAAYVAGRFVADRRRSFTFKNKLVLVTGGSRGLGLILARKLIRRGARVAICSRDGEKLEHAARELEQIAGSDVTKRVFYKVCDLTRDDHISELLDSVRGWGGSIDVLINNAGTITAGPIESMQDDDFAQSLDMYFWAPWHLIQAVLPDMRQKRAGRIVNIASIAGLISVPHLVPYSVGKHALRGLSEGLRTELMKDGIYVTTVCPGLMRTGSHIHAHFKGRHRAEQTWFSLMNANPLLSMNADRAAEKILRAVEKGRGSLVLTLPAQIAATSDRLANELTTDAIGTVASFLPGPTTRNSPARPGWRSTSSLSPSILTTLSDRAVARNNE